MKMLFVCVLVLLSVNLFAQEQKEVQTLPELQEWYSIKGGFTGSYISYLPDFDSAGGGLHAITQGRDGDGVWYNRFPFDTLSQFRWKKEGSYAVFPVDFNNDGLPEYVDANGNVYTTTQKGKMPNPEPVITLLNKGFNKPLIGDFNNDGITDVLAFNSTKSFDVIFGNKDLSKITAISVQYPNPSVYIGGYFTEKKEPRIVVYRDGTVTETFYLYGITVVNGEKPVVEIKEIDKKQRIKSNKDEAVYSMYITNLFWDKKNNKSYIISGYNSEIKTAIFTITNDRIAEEKTIEVSIGTPHVLKASINNDEVDDMICLTQINKQTNEQRYVVYSGNEIESLIPRAFLPKNVCTIDGSISYIGDVNNDGYNDIALGASGCFTVYLGREWNTSDVQTETSPTNFTLSQNIPNPIQKDRKTILPVSIKNSALYTIVLYDIRGSKLAKMFSGYLEEGNHNISLDLSHYPVGMYIVGMSDGKQTRERLMMIGE